MKEQKSDDYYKGYSDGLKLGAMLCVGCIAVMYIMFIIIIKQ